MAKRNEAKKGRGIQEVGANKVGRPSSYTKEVGDAICDEIATSATSLRSICSREDMPSVVTVMKWLRDFPEFLNQYARAREAQADIIFDEMLDIADNSNADTVMTEDGRIIENKDVVNRSRLQIDTRKWILSKLQPKKYGDKIDLTTDGKAINQSGVNPEQFAKLLEQAKNNATTSGKGQ